MCDCLANSVEVDQWELVVSPVWPRVLRYVYTEFVVSPFGYMCWGRYVEFLVSLLPTNVEVGLWNLCYRRLANSIEVGTWNLWYRSLATSVEVAQLELVLSSHVNK